MDTKTLDGADLNYWVAWVLGVPLGRVEIASEQCIRSDDQRLDYIHDQSMLHLFRERRFFDTSARDQLVDTVSADPLKRFIARLTRDQGSCEAYGPTALIAVCRVVVMFAFQYGTSALPDGRG